MNLCANDLHNSTGKKMIEVCKQKKRILKVNLRMNSIHRKYIEKLDEICRSNKNRITKNKIPEYRFELKKHVIDKNEITHINKEIPKISSQFNASKKAYEETLIKFEMIKTEEKILTNEKANELLKLENTIQDMISMIAKEDENFKIIQKASKMQRGDVNFKLKLIVEETNLIEKKGKF